MAAEHSTEDGREVPVLESNRHDHHVRKFKNRDVYTCDGCKEEGLNSGYECFPPPCTNSGEVRNFHVHCIDLKDEEQRPILTHRKFRFRRETSFSHRCTACAHKLEGFVYETENHDMRLHPLCLMLPTELKYEGQSLTLQKGKFEEYKCCHCKRPIKHGWRYISREEDCMDVPCAKYQIHGLSGKRIPSSPVRRHRDDVQKIWDCATSCFTIAAGAVGIAQNVQDVLADET